MSNNTIKTKQHKEVQNLAMKISSIVCVIFGIMVIRKKNIDNAYIVLLVILCAIFLFVLDSGKEKTSEEKKDSTSEEAAKEKAEKEKNDAYERNLPIFLEEARNTYYKKLVSEGFSLKSYFDDSPFEICGYNEGLKIIPKWEVYELYIKTSSEYKNDIIEKSSGSKVKFYVSLYSVKYDNYGSYIDWDEPTTGIHRALADYTIRLYNRSADEKKKFKESEMKAREKYNSSF